MTGVDELCSLLVLIGLLYLAICQYNNLERRLTPPTMSRHIANCWVKPSSAGFNLPMISSGKPVRSEIYLPAIFWIHSSKYDYIQRSPHWETYLI